jgi:pimeloyl-ACP methyl ester carboxylesterase
MHWLFVSIAFFVTTIEATAQGPAVSRLDLPATAGDFYGYRQYDFTFNERSCKIVEPKVAAKGLPWIWRARFWGHEPQTDTTLLGKGYHVVYCDVVELFGNPQAVAIWNRFYKKMRKVGLAKKVVLEGMSRGGLYIYNWAAENPKKVACIYADAPVLDIRSWPGGLGKGPGARQEWEACKKAWNLNTEEDISTFRGNPLDKVKKIVRGGYPLLHVCGEDDEVVPMAENTDLFEQKILDHGGRITVIRKRGVKHHPHSLKDPTLIVNFIEQHYRY